MSGNKTLTLGSLFDGSGSFPFGGILAGIEPKWNSEIEPFPVLVTHKRLPQVKHYGDVSGISGADLEPVDIITFGSPCQDLSIDGFTGVRDQEHLEAFMKLAAAMNKMAQTQKRVRAKDTDDTNEKYSLRVWLVRLGLNGPEYKSERKILMENLSGHAAFRTPADEEKWKARQQTKKLALKAAKEETTEAE